MLNTGPRSLTMVPVAWVKDNYDFLLLIIALILFATKTLFIVPFALMALTGAFRIFRKPAEFVNSPAVVALFIVFLCLWLPQLLSLVDAINPARSLQTTLPYIHFFFAGVFIITTMQRPGRMEKLSWIVFIIISLWCMDALIQFFAGIDIFGYPYDDNGRLAGMFYPKLRLGHIIAVFLPFYLEMIRKQRAGYKWLWLMLIPLFAVLLLNGKRVAWIMAVFACLGYVVYLWIYFKHARLKQFALPVLFVGICLGVLFFGYKPFHDRLAVSFGLFSGNYEQADKASAGRLELWGPTLKMIQSNWLNGVGTRGFRFAFSSYAEPDNFWISGANNGQTHPHQMFLEIAAETGLLGVLGYLALWFYLVKLAGAGSIDYGLSIPWLLCVFISIFPLNAHLAFYGSYWSSVTWWLLSITVAALHHQNRLPNNV